MEKHIIPVAFVVLTLLLSPLFTNLVYADTLTWYNLSSNNVNFCLSNSTPMFGENPATLTSIIHGKSINSLTATLSKNGAPTANYLVGVWGNGTTPTNLNYKYLISTNSSSALTTTPTAYTFTNLDESYTLTTGDVVGLFFDSATGNVCIRANDFGTVGASYDGANSRESNYSTAGSSFGYAGGGKYDMTFIISITDSNEPQSNTGQQDGVCLNGTALQCVGDRSNINMITGSPALTGTVNNLLVGVGVVNVTNSDIQTNGTGLIMMLATGAFFSSVTIASIAVANNKFGANIQYTQIPKEYWLFLVVGVVALAYYLQWIPDIVFYGMIVGLAGLFAFGLYKQFNGNGG